MVLCLSEKLADLCSCHTSSFPALCNEVSCEGHRRQHIAAIGLHNPLKVALFTVSEAELQSSSTVKRVGPQVETKTCLLPHPTSQLIIPSEHPEIVTFHKM